MIEVIEIKNTIRALLRDERLTDEEVDALIELTGVYDGFLRVDELTAEYLRSLLSNQQGQA